MFREDELRSLVEGRRILIAGYGSEGKSTHRMLKKLLPGVEPEISTDDVQTATLAQKAELIIKSPGIPLWVLPADALERTTSMTDLFLRVYADKTIGITGTKGKSTTTSLIHHLLPDSILAGNIGIPLFDVVEQMDEGSTVVAELSCHQLEILHRAPHVALLLNLFQEHLDHYADYRAYKMAKLNIGLRQQEGDTFIFCEENEELRTLVGEERGKMRGRLMPYSLSSATEELRKTIETCPLRGTHNQSNTLAALLVSTCMTGRRVEELAPALPSFKPLGHRMQPIGTMHGLHWVDDSISTIPEATIAAVEAFGGVETLIVGGFDRGIDYQPLVRYMVDNRKVRNVAFTGAAGRRIKKEMEEYAKRIGLRAEELLTMTVEDNYGEIVHWCAKTTREGGTVLLSPAAASYDAFKNFEQRGDYFAKLVNCKPE